MKDFTSPNYTASMNSLKEVYAELAVDQFHIERMPEDRENITDNLDKPYAFFERATADKLLVRRRGELHFTALATDIESFLFGPPGTILAENKYGANATAAVNAIRHASKSKLN